ncbi:hypothetical protein M2165_003114 [Variovorax sp. TBS-050B]|uniref:hypothetical protein n=1 Tax=Variovorax sp. TBS-050B TaxID=2940551 RepID=UPI0024766A73|nr:hypothetical protein [Variovorax sp. TBS-050B]MDH6593225.1 hypothetical protein [Variovorax sp. TBS-050B]
MESWFADAKPIDSLEPEIAFLLSEELRAVAHLPPAPLTLPSFPRAERLRARSVEVPGHEAELAAYYARLAALARRQGLRFDQVQHYFRLDLRLDNEAADVHLSFPWHDSFAAIDTVLRALAGPDEGLVYDDQDQGWAVEIWARNGTLYIRERDPETDDDPGLAVALPRAGLQARIAPLRERTAKLVAALAKEPGPPMWPGDTAPATWAPDPR